MHEMKEIARERRIRTFNLANAHHFYLSISFHSAFCSTTVYIEISYLTHALVRVREKNLKETLNFFMSMRIVRVVNSLDQYLKTKL